MQHTCTVGMTCNTPTAVTETVSQLKARLQPTFESGLRPCKPCQSGRYASQYESVKPSLQQRWLQPQQSAPLGTLLVLQRESGFSWKTTARSLWPEYPRALNHVHTQPVWPGRAEAIGICDRAIQKAPRQRGGQLELCAGQGTDSITLQVCCSKQSLACPLQVYLVSVQKKVDITTLWGDQDRAVLVFARSMGYALSSCSHTPLQIVSSAAWHSGDGHNAVIHAPPHSLLPFSALTLNKVGNMIEYRGDWMSGPITMF